MGSSASKASKAASNLPAGAINTARKYPTRTPPTSTTTNAQPRRPSPTANLGPTVHPDTKASGSRNTGINLDASDPDLALNARLKSLGPVQPNPTHSNSSTFNAAHPPNARSHTDPALTVTHFQPSASNPTQTIYPTSAGPAQRLNPAVSLLTARYRLAEEAEREFAQTGKSSAVGRQFLDVITLRQVLVMRDEGGLEDAEIERRLSLRRGVVERLGRRGVVGVGS